MRRRRPKRAGHGWLLLLERDGWQILHQELSGKVAVPPEALAEQADAICEALRSAGWRSEPVVVGLAAELCLATTVPVPSPALVRKRQAMRFHVEEWIPWSAEEYVVDYVPHPGEAFMAATLIEPLRTLLLSLDERDVHCTALVPAALLALQNALAQNDMPDECVLLWPHDDQTELYHLRERRAVAWRHATGATLGMAAGMRLSLPETINWYGAEMSPFEAATLREQGFPINELADVNWQTSLRDAVAALAAGAAEPIIDLARDELAGRRASQALVAPLRRLKAAAFILLTAVCASLGMRGEQLRSAAEESRSSLVEIFERTFPEKAIPDRIAAVLRSEHALLKGTRGADNALPAGYSSELVLNRVLESLPAELRFRVPEVRVEGENVHLAGEVRTNSDADQIAGALRHAGFDVQPPHTQRLSGEGFTAHWTARWASATHHPP